MKDENTIVAKRLPDGTLVEVLADGSTRPFPTDSTDWAALDAMTEEEAEAGARCDPENPPLTPERGARLKRVPPVKIMRRAMGLSQEAFSARFHVPIAALREWEQGVSEPDETARANLTVIARDPEAVRRALQLGPARAGKQFG
jgi:putative transcriptional regulator